MFLFTSKQFLRPGTPSRGVARKARDNQVRANRVTFLIDREGGIRHIRDKVKVDGHTEEVLSKIRELGLATDEEPGIFLEVG